MTSIESFRIGLPDIRDLARFVMFWPYACDAVSGEPESTEPVRQKQLRQVRAACGCVALFFVVCAVLGGIAPALRWLSTLGRGDGVTIANFSELSGAAIWIGVVSLICWSSL